MKFKLYDFIYVISKLNLIRFFIYCKYLVEIVILIVKIHKFLNKNNKILNNSLIK